MHKMLGSFSIFLRHKFASLATKKVKRHPMRNGVLGRPISQAREGRYWNTDSIQKRGHVESDALIVNSVRCFCTES